MLLSSYTISLSVCLSVSLSLSLCPRRAWRWSRSLTANGSFDGLRWRRTSITRWCVTWPLRLTTSLTAWPDVTLAATLTIPFSTPSHNRARFPFFFAKYDNELECVHRQTGSRICHFILSVVARPKDHPRSQSRTTRSDNISETAQDGDVIITDN